MFEQYMRNAMILIMDDPDTGSTLMEIPKVLADEEFRNLKLSKCKTQVVKDFWQKEAQKAGGEASLQNMVPYITSKLTPFISNDVMRPIIGQQKSAFNVRQAMDEGKILLLNLSKGKLGDINAYLIGMVLVGKILMAALSRTDMDPKRQKGFFLYIDEFQNFLTDSISAILSESSQIRFRSRCRSPIHRTTHAKRGYVDTRCDIWKRWKYDGFPSRTGRCGISGEGIRSCIFFVRFNQRQKLSRVMRKS